MHYIDLFEGLERGIIQSRTNGALLTIKSTEPTGYTVFTLIAFDHVKEIQPDGNGVAFSSDGHKVFMIYEPITYPKKYEEPYLRDEPEQVPLRFSETEQVEVEKQCRFYVSRQPFFSSGSFTTVSPEVGTVAVYFLDGPDMYPQILEYVSRELHTTYNVPSRLVEKIQALLQQNFDLIMHPSG